jgi:hypothetical protein
MINWNKAIQDALFRISNCLDCCCLLNTTPLEIRRKDFYCRTCNNKAWDSICGFSPVGFSSLGEPITVKITYEYK